MTFAEHVPVHDMMGVYHMARAKGARVIGPNSFGVISPGKSKAGFMAHRIFKPGHVGLMSRSATNCYETVFMMSNAGIGQSTCVGVGGDMIPGSTFIDILPLFEADDETKAIVMIGEIGGSEEELAAEYIKKHVTKPVVGSDCRQEQLPRERVWDMPVRSLLPTEPEAQRTMKRLSARQAYILPKLRAVSSIY